MDDTLKMIQKQAFEDLEDARSRFQGWADGIVDEARKAVREEIVARRAQDPAATRRMVPISARHGTIRLISNSGKGSLWVDHRWWLLEGESIRLFSCARHGWQDANEHDGCSACAEENRIIANPDPKRCNNDYHPPECDSRGALCQQLETPIKVEPAEAKCGVVNCVREQGHEGDCSLGMTHCKACGAGIYIGNCCGEACTKVWLAEIEQAHRDKSKGKRFCRNCGAAHEVKSSFCGQCHRDQT
jgi:hypothetical protein